MKTNKINSLTPAQEHSLEEYRDEWLRYGRSTEPADRSTAETAISSMYAALGKQRPYFWWCDGPAVGSSVRCLLGANLGANLRANLRANLWANLWDNLWANLRDNLWANLRDNLWANLGANLRANLGANLRDNLWANLRDNLWANLGANLWANLGANLRANLGANLRANLRDNLWANLGGNLGANLRANLGANLRDNLGDNLRANLRDNLWANLGANLGDNLGDNLSWGCWGQHEAAWPAYYAWPHEVLRPMHTETQTTTLGWWLALSRSCGWWHPFEGIVFVCERPAKQQIDGRGRLHCDDGPALLCRDGWPVHAIHGIRVPADIVERPDTITVTRIDAETNAEVRRVMIERYGFARYLRDAGIKEIQRDDFGVLYRKEPPNEPAMQFVRVVNSTPEPDGTFREYVLPVRNTVKTAHEAVASSFELEVATYNPSFES